MKFLDRQQQADLRELVSAWQYEHPDQYRVEGVRFQEFSEHAGQIEDARTKKARGLLGQVQSATMAADQALVISERAFFVAHRMPFLIRLQARLGVQETLSDTLARLDDVDSLLHRVQGMRPMLEDVATLTNNATAAVRETRALAEVVEPHLHRLTETGRPREGGDIGKNVERRQSPDRAVIVAGSRAPRSDARRSTAIDRGDRATPGSRAEALDHLHSDGSVRLDGVLLVRVLLGEEALVSSTAESS